MKLSRANLLAVRVAGVDRKDEALRQLRVERDGSTAASDGTAIMVVEPVGDAASAAFPSLSAGEVSVGVGGVGLGKEVAEETLKNMPRGMLGVELGYAVMSRNDDRGAALTTTDLSKEQTVEGAKARKQFPEWTNVMREGRRDGNVRVCLDRRGLLRLLKAMEEACGGGDHLAFMEVGEKGIFVRGIDVRTGQRAMGYVKGVDVVGEWLHYGNWERSVLGKTRKRHVKNFDAGAEDAIGGNLQDDGERKGAAHPRRKRRKRLSRRSGRGKKIPRGS